MVVSNQNGVDPLLYDLKQLNFLDISKCTLSDLSDDLGNFTELTKLSLRHDSLSRLPASIGCLTNLKFLDISFNSISALPSSIFADLLHLETLMIDSNSLTELPSLKGLMDLHHLSVSNNSLLYLPESITSCPKLMSIDVSSNKISELSNDFDWGNLANLQHFNLSNNQLTTVPKTLVECKKLKDLQLRENPLKDSRLKKLASSTRPGPALISYLAKAGKVDDKSRSKVSKPTQNVVVDRNLKTLVVDSPLTKDLVIDYNEDDEVNVII